jgi:hypothetical protein
MDSAQKVPVSFPLKETFTAQPVGRSISLKKKQQRSSISFNTQGKEVKP